MSATLPRTDHPTAGPNGRPGAAQLPRRLTTLGGFVLAISNVGPTISIGIGLGVLATVVGAQAPLMFVLAFLPMMGIAVSYAFLNRVEANCGTAYVWLRTAFNPWVGFLCGWVTVAAAVIFISYGAPLAGKITVALAQALGVGAADPGSVFQGAVVGLLWLALVTYFAVRGTDVAVRSQLVLVSLELLFVGAIIALALVKGDASPVRASWFDPTAIPSVQVLAGGMVLAVYVFWGWDSAFSVTEETATPGQAARAGFTTLVVVLVLFVVASIAFQRALTPRELETHGALGLPYLGQKLGGDTGELVATVALLFSAIAVLQSSVIAAARMTFAMGRDRTLGAGWTVLHPRYGTPARATIRLAVIAALIAALSAALGPLQTVIVGVVTAIGILISVTYGLAGLAAAWRFRDWLRTHPARALLAVVLPALSALALFLLGGYLFWQQATSTDHLAFDATNGWFLDLLPMVVIAVGLVLAAWTRFVRKAPYFTDLSVAPALSEQS